MAIISGSEPTTGRIKISKHSEKHLLKVIADMKSLLDRIDRDIPLLQLAISASGETLSTSLPPTISPSRLLQASTFIAMGDSLFARGSKEPVQIGPTFSLSLYMLFLAHTAPNGDNRDSWDNYTNNYGLDENYRRPIWQEVMHKVTARLYRYNQNWGIPRHHLQGSDRNSSTNCQEYHYYLDLIEDLNDGRLHHDTETGISPRAGCLPSRQERIPIHQFSRIFYTDTGKLLNIRDTTEEENRPVLLLKRDANAATQEPTKVECSPGSRTGERGDSAKQKDSDEDQGLVDMQIHHEIHNTEINQSEGKTTAFSNLPNHLDPEWLALEMFVEDVDGGEESEGDEDTNTSRIDCKEDSHIIDDTGIDNLADCSLDKATQCLLDSSLLTEMVECSIQENATVHRDQVTDISPNQKQSQDAVAPPFSAVTTSLSLLEMMIRLVGLQEFQQMSHLSIPDHILTFFLEETSTTGVTGSQREKLRRETKQRVGFDPYTGDSVT